MVVRRSVSAFYLFTGLRWFRLTGAIWMLYLLHVGWMLWQVGAAEGFFHVVGFLAAVPTGVYADRMGRRRSLVVGLIIAVIAGLAIYLTAPVSVLAGIGAMGLSSLSWSFIGGADQALLYDLTRSRPDARRAYRNVLARVNALSLLSGAAAAVAGGWLAVHWGWAWPYVLAAGAEALAIPCVLLLPEPRREPTPAAAFTAGGTWMDTLRTTKSAVRRLPGVLALVVFGAVLGVVATSNHLYAQTTLSVKGETIVAVTAIIAVGGLLAALGSLLSRHLPPGPVSSGALRRGTLVLAALVAAVGVLPAAQSVGAFMASGLLDGGVDVLYVAELSQASPDVLRATVLSAPDMLFSLGMIVCFPAEGWAMQRYGPQAAYLALGVTLAAAALWLVRHASRGQPGLPAGESG